MDRCKDLLTATQKRCAELEQANAQLQRINTSLMDRVERDMDRQGNSFSLFQAATVLESKVHERTVALKQAMHTLERTNRELKESTDAARAANRAKSAFLAAMSHELRTPMNGVVGMTEYLLRTEMSPRQRKSLDTIRRSALSLLHILNSILDFSKIEAGHLQLEATAFDLRRVAEQTVALLRPQFDSKGLPLQIDWPEELPVAMIGDPTRFSQVLTNLIGNALKFTARGHVTLRARLVGCDHDTARFRFEIEDTGIGIRPEVIPHLFKSFSQADSSTTRKFGGTGLGLAIVQRLCRLMDGDCGVASEYGRGSRFWFEVCLRNNLAPTSASEGTAVMRLLEAPGDGRSRKLRVLLVEDNLVNQEVAGALLETLDCECTIAANGVLAVRALTDRHEFDLVLMDCQMPEMDGFQATRLVREHERKAGGRVPIVALTANAMSGDREQCLAAGMDDFLSKPFQRHELGTVLRRWCRPCEAAAPVIPLGIPA